MNTSFIDLLKKDTLKDGGSAALYAGRSVKPWFSWLPTFLEILERYLNGDWLVSKKLDWEQMDTP